MPKKMWSPAQWSLYNPQIVVDGWQRNCCKQCQDIEGWYFNARAAGKEAPNARAAGKEAPTATPHPPPEKHIWKPNTAKMALQCDNCMHWLQRNIGEKCWESMDARMCQINLDRRQELIRINSRLNLSDRKSFKKLVPYDGSIRVPDDFPDKLVTWFDPCLKERSLDPGNLIYQKAFRRVWPNVLPHVQNEETVGDLVEALLAIAWKFRVLGIALSTLALDFVEQLESLICCEYTLYHWGQQ